MFSELHVIVKNNEKRLIKKFHCHELFSVSENDPFVRSCLDETVKEFGHEPEDISIKITMEIQ